MAYNLYDDNEDEATQPPICDFPGCEEAGLYPAPKSRQRLNERFHFCLEHVREYNKKWNFFEGFSEEQMYSQMRKDMVGDRPTWPSSIPLKLEARLHEFIRKFTKDTGSAPQTKAAVTKEAQALETMGLGPQADTKSIKARYRELVKKYHPDTNPNNPKAVERFKIISEAYMILRANWHTKE